MGKQARRREIRFRPIGVIRTPHTVAERTPIQPIFASGVRGRVELFADYAEGLRDLGGFSHVYLFYLFDRAGSPQLLVRPYLDRRKRGVFATRSPRRPNPLGLSLVRLIRREGATLHVEDVDILDGTPLVDIKPFFRRFDARDDARSGWLDRVDESAVRAGGHGAEEPPDDPR